MVFVHDVTNTKEKRSGTLLFIPSLIQAISIVNNSHDFSTQSMYTYRTPMDQKR